MENETWLIAKKEDQLNPKGEIIGTFITYVQPPPKTSGLEQKDYIDLLIKIIGIIAIFIPILLFYFQQKSELEKEKYLLEFDVYSTLDAELHSYLSKVREPIEFEKSKNRLLYELLPKSSLFKNALISDSLQSIRKDIIFFYTYYETSKFSDSLFQFLLDRIITNNKKNILSNTQDNQKYNRWFEGFYYSRAPFSNTNESSYKTLEKNFNMQDSIISQLHNNFWFSMYKSLNVQKYTQDQINDRITDYEIAKISNKAIIDSLSLNFDQELKVFDSIIASSNKLLR